MMKRWTAGGMVLIAALWAAPACAEVTRLDILERGPAFGGQAFGPVGSYERIRARLHGELDPMAVDNAVIQDIGLAPRNAHGRVEYSSDIDILRPTDAQQARPLLLFEVPNRGRRLMLGAFNADMKGPPAALAALQVAGDGFLQRSGATLIWFGWQGDILPGEERLTATLPIARQADGSPLTGTVRSELTTLAPTPVLNLSSGWFTLMNHRSYPTVELDNRRRLPDGFVPSLTVRPRESAPRVEIPADQWHFGACDASAPHNDRQVCLPAGFQPGRLYEIIYRAKDPMVMGIGFAIARDVGAFFAHAEQDRAGTANPVVHGESVKALVFGSSQSGRFIRSMIALGFNRSETGRRVFDGAMPHIGGGLLPLNVRFSQPGRAWGQQVDHDYPAYDFPFTYGPETDPLTGRTAGLLDACTRTQTCPLLFHMATSLELWEGRQSLGLTDPLGQRDLPEPANVRTYIMASTQHAPAAWPLPQQPPYGLCRQASNPNPHLWTLRAGLDNLVAWVRDGTVPPDSAVPRIADGSLVAPDRVHFPAIPATRYDGADRPAPRYTGQVNTLHVLDFGPDYRPLESSGILHEPPTSGNAAYGLLVPQVDSDGIDIAGVRNVYLQAPIGTYTGWNTFRPALFEGNFCNFQGSFIPFARTEAERLAAGDPRPSLQARYPTQQAYVEALRRGADRLVAQGLMRAEDRDRVVGEAESGGIRQGP
ncbi:MAG: hypothetical protein JOY84_12595 [Curvibacter sp.]|nr:hypothetical protein [Curvibacter sp.]